LLNEVLQAVRLARRDDEVLRPLLLQHAPHGVHVFWRPAPIALDLEVAEPQLLVAAGGDARGTGDDLTGDEALRPQR
jgi:hypothetical protein